MDEDTPLFDINIISDTTSPSGELRKQPPEPSPPKEIINPDLNSRILYEGFARDTDISDDPALLFLTNYKSFQHKVDNRLKEYIKELKLEMRGKLFELRKTSPNFCGTFKSAKLRVSGNKLLEVIVSKIPCNSWTCPVCSIRKAIRLKFWLRDIILLNDLDYFITLTLDLKTIPDEYRGDTHRYITKLFNHFLTVLRRKKYKYFHKNSGRYFFFDLTKAKDKLKYVWVIEFQKDTHNAHMHILTNQYLPAVVIRSIWEDVGGGTQMRLEKVRSKKGVSNYITDYIVKGIKSTKYQVSHGYGFKYFQRRYSVSKSCSKPQKKMNELFKLLPNELKEKELIKQNLGWIVKELYNNDRGYCKYRFDSNIPAQQKL